MLVKFYLYALKQNIEFKIVEKWLFVKQDTEVELTLTSVSKGTLHFFQNPEYR